MQSLADREEDMEGGRECSEEETGSLDHNEEECNYAATSKWGEGKTQK